MIVNGKPWLVDDELSARWPLYTRGNVGEVFPDVVTPLNWTLLGSAVEESWREAWREFGIVAPGDFDAERVIVCIAGGYCYLNMSYIRLLGVRVPGSSVKAVDKQFLGEVDAPPYVDRAGDRNFLPETPVGDRKDIADPTTKNRRGHAPRLQGMGGALSQRQSPG
jgi:pyruvate,water dikinase